MKLTILKKTCFYICIGLIILGNTNMHSMDGVKIEDDSSVEEVPYGGGNRFSCASVQAITQINPHPRSQEEQALIVEGLRIKTENDKIILDANKKALDEANKKTSDDLSIFSVMKYRAVMGASDAFGQQIGALGGKLLVDGLVYSFSYAYDKLSSKSDLDADQNNSGIDADGRIDINKIPPQKLQKMLAMQEMQRLQEVHQMKAEAHMMKAESHMVNSFEKEGQLIHASLRNIALLKDSMNTDESEAFENAYKQHLKVQLIHLHNHLQHKEAMQMQQFQHQQEAQGRNR